MKETEVTRQQSAREMQERLTELETNRQILASQMSILHSEKQDLLRQLDIAHYETAELKKLPTPDDYSIVKTENRHLEREISRLEKSLQVLYYPVRLRHFLHSLGNYTRRAIFPEMCKINQSSVDFHCEPL